MLQLCKSVQCAYRFKNLLRPNMHRRQGSVPKADTKKLAIAVCVLQNTNLVSSCCCFVEVGKEMYQDSKRTCIAIFLLIKPFVWWPSRHRRGLLKLPDVLRSMRPSPLLENLIHVSAVRQFPNISATNYFSVWVKTAKTNITVEHSLSMQLTWLSWIRDEI